MNVYLTRIRKDDKQIEGYLSVVHGGLIFSCLTLELPYKDNQTDISSISPGVYEWEKFESPSFETTVIKLKFVPNRKDIEIHYGNYYTNTNGCILVGDEFKDINDDGHRDVLNSKKTLEELISILPNSGVIYINEIFV